MPAPGKELTFRKNQTIVFEGDSLTMRRQGKALDTWPYLRLMDWEVTWSQIMAELLFCWRPDLSLDFKHLAVGGSNSRNVLQRMEEERIPHKVDWVLMTIGNNDSKQGISVREMRQTLRTYVGHIQNTYGGQVVFLGGFKAGPGIEESKEQFAKKAKYYGALRTLAQETGHHYLDVGKPLNAKARALTKQWEDHTIYSDGVHFNRVGATILAGEVLRAFGVVAETP